MDNESLGVVDTLAGFEHLETEWRELSRQATDAPLFLDWDWHHAWWQIFAEPDDRLHIITLRVEGALVALLPMYRKPGTFYQGPSLNLIGTGEARADEVATEYADLLTGADVDDDTRRRWAGLVLFHLTRFSDWHRVEFLCMLDDSSILEAARSIDAPLARLESPAGRRYRTCLADGEEAHLGRLGETRLRRIERSRRAVERSGGIHRSSLIDSDGDDSLFESLVRLSSERLESRGKQPSFASVRFEKFHRELINRWGATGRADVICYEIEGATRAAIYCFADGTTCHYYQSGFSKDGANRFMPLTLAHLAEMQHRRADGYLWYDLMRGRPGSYKEELGCESDPMWDLSLFRSQRSGQWNALRRRWRARLVRTLARVNITRNH